MQLLSGTTVFLSAFLLFQLEPIIGKLILPWFGGVAAVWSICLLFFQLTLLLGYLYAHLLTKFFSLSTQKTIHIALLAFSCATLPILPRSSMVASSADNPALHVLLVLALTVGFPYFILSTTSPLVQSWLSTPNQSTSPYHLFAVSNVGALLGLLSYPFLVEPRLSGHRQAVLWSLAYAGAAMFCAATALSNRSITSVGELDVRRSRTTVSLKWLWLALAACPSALLLAVTNHITQNVAAIPLLWVVPLSIYLSTFVLSFQQRSMYHRGFALRFGAVLLACMAYALAPNRANLPPYVLIPLFCAGLFACCFICHGELARLKPDVAHLTSYYLMISVGGAVGALFVGLIAPFAFRGYYELSVSLGFYGVLVLLVLYHDRQVVLVSRPSKLLFLTGVILVVTLCCSLYITARAETAQARVAARNFYGVLRVQDRGPAGIVLIRGGTTQLLGPDIRYRVLLNGTIEHGLQFLAADRREQTTTYYTSHSGIGMALSAAGQHGPIKVAMIGLGAGTIAAYGRPADQYTFYEINPLVVQVAQSQFSFLKLSPAKVRIVQGDGRLSLQREPEQRFDVLGVDAFSSDAIPVHLLTREAFELYLQRITSTGIIAVHISNKYLDLSPMVRAAAASLQLTSVTITNPADESKLAYEATWVLISRNGGILDNAEFRSIDRPSGVPVARVWTDDYSSPLGTLK